METRYTIIKNKRELKKLIDCCKATGYACCDYETNAEPIYNLSLIHIQMCIRDRLNQAREEFKQYLPGEDITFVQGKVLNWSNFTI